MYVEPGSGDLRPGTRCQSKIGSRQKLRGMAHLLVTKHTSEPLRRALEGVVGQRKLGESHTRLVVPAWHPVLERVYIYKTAHHPRLETDYNQPAIDAAMATAAAPTFLKPYMTESAVELVDGGVWANNPIGVATIEAIGMLGWPGDRLKILSIGTISEPGRLPRLRGKLPMAASVWVYSWLVRRTARSVLPRSSPAMSTRERRYGTSIRRRREGRYTLDNAQRISEMRDRAFAEAREQLPGSSDTFFQAPAENFRSVPFPSRRRRWRRISLSSPGNSGQAGGFIPRRGPMSTSCTGCRGAGRILGSIRRCTWRSTVPALASHHFRCAIRSTKSNSNPRSLTVTLAISNKPI